MLKDFCDGVQRRVKAGFDPTLIISLLPVIMEMIAACFNKSSDLQAFAEGKRGPLQLARLRLKLRQVVQEQGIKGVVRIANATGELQAAVLAELDARAQLSAGPDVYAQAFEEALSG